MVQLHRREDEIEAAGARLVVIGNGAASFIEGFRDKIGYTGEVYTDPKRSVYRALELRRSVRSTFSLRGVKNAVTAYRDGHRQTRTQGDPFQQGGVFVIDTAGAIHFQYRSEFAGDHPAVQDVIAALP